MAKKDHHNFIEAVYGYYRDHGRVLPWRQTEDAYRIMVSEVMLQQTQTQRVIPKYQEFLERFPDMETLARAPLSDVLRQWQGLGYNRRGRWLHQAAQNLRVKAQPWSLEDLEAQKGIGHNTAAAILVYAYNQPHVFIETNVRAVFIHHFFARESEGVEDKAILPLVAETLDKKDPRLWYWALMDYGVHIKKLHRNPARRSKQHVQQSQFEGSLRQLRARILREVLAAGQLHVSEILQLFDDTRVKQALHTLVADELLQEHKQFYSVPLS